VLPVNSTFLVSAIIDKSVVVYIAPPLFEAILFLKEVSMSFNEPLL